MLFKKDDVVIFIGDSITDCGRKKPEGEGSILGDALGNGFVNMINTRLYIDFPSYNLRIINKGCNGHRTQELIQRWNEDVLSYNPDWVFITIGINDVWRNFDSPQIKNTLTTREQYGKNLQKMITDTIAVTKNIVLISPYLIERHTANDPMLNEMDNFRKEMSSIALKNNIKYIDLQNIFDKALNNLDITLLSRDRIHVSHIGNTLISDALLNTIYGK